MRINTTLNELSDYHGDTVRYENKTFFINGEEIQKEYIENITVSTSIGGLAGTLSSETLGSVVHPTQHIDVAGGRRLRTTWVCLMVTTL